MKFGDRLVKLRRERKLTQQDVADKLNISRSAYAGYEIGRRVPEYSTLENMANMFEVSIDFIVGRSDKKNDDSNHQNQEADNLIELTDDELLDLPLAYEGMELTQEEKIEFIAIARGILAARKALKEKH